MKEIKTKKEVKLIERLKEELTYAEGTLDQIQAENPELLDVENSQKAISQVKKDCIDLIERFHQSATNDLLSLIKNGNTILVNTTDAISYSEDQYYHILDEKPDWRGMIKFALLKIGKGDTGSWISYTDIEFKDLDEFIQLLKTFKHSLVDYERMDKFIQFTKTIPELN